jgi:SAM-dependent methyltransferase
MDKDRKSGAIGNDNVAPIDFAVYSSYLAYQAPLQVSFIAAMHRLGRGPLTGDFVYAQVGMGDAMALAVLADCYPEGRFIGLDSDPAAVEKGRTLAREAGLGNLSINEGGLTGEGLPDCDIVVLSRMYSALPPAGRQQAAASLAKRLKPGGLLCIQYSALPGAASADALFNFLREVSATLEGEPRDRLAGALARAVDLARGEAFVFRQFPLAAEMLQRMTQTDPAFGAREVFNTGLHGLYVTEVMAEIAPTGLVYAGNGQLSNNFLELGLPQALRAGAEAIHSVPARELYLDYARNAQARMDIYAKPQGGALQDTAELLSDFLVMRFAGGPETLRRQQIAQNTGVDFTAQLYTDLLSVLSPAPRSIASLLDEPVVKKHARGRALKAIQLLIGTELAGLARMRSTPETGLLPDRLRLTSTLNRLTLERTLDNPDIVPFSTQLTGQRLVLALAQRLSLHALLGGDLDPVYAAIEARGLEFTDKEGKRASAEEFKSSILAELPRFRAQDGALLRALGVLAEGSVQ